MKTNTGLDSITIDTGIKRIAINNDPDRVISFNPSDVSFAERFYGIMKEFEDKTGEYQKLAEEIEKNSEVDDNGIQKNTPESLALLRTMNEYIREKIDEVFGAGTSQIAFGDALNIDMFAQFFEGITPFISSARADKMKRYMANGKVTKVMTR